MLTVETIAKIRRDYHVEKKGIKQIARERCVSRNTVRKVIRKDEVEFRYERKKPRNSKLDAYRQDLEELLSNNAERPVRSRATVLQIFQELSARGQTAVFRPRRINPWVNLCIKLTENASDASVFSVSLKRSFLTQVYPQIYFHSVPADKSRIPGIGKYCNTATAVSAVGFELDTNTNFEVKRISHKRRKCSGFILTATKVRICITDTVHFDWNQCSNCRNQCSFLLEYASRYFLKVLAVMMTAKANGRMIQDGCKLTSTFGFKVTWLTETS